MDNTGKNRMAHFELLRLICMLMVVALHYLGKGQLLPTFLESLPTGNEVLSSLIESFCIVAVNVFILLSGYFMVEKEFHMKRLLRLEVQVLTYSLLVPVGLLIGGVLKFSDLNLYDVIYDFCPVLTEEYWFITHYFFLLLFVPLLNKGIHGMNKKQLKQLIFTLLAAFSIPKVILPVAIPYDKGGYDLIWFLVLYLIAAYIRFYGLPILDSSKKSGLFYLIFVLAVFMWNMGIGYFYFYTGKFQDQLGEALQYNHILNLLASVAFFGIFFHGNIKSTNLSRLILKVSPYALGVYLLHEQTQMRYLWPELLQVHEIGQTRWFLPHFILTVLGIFLVGLSVEAFRNKVMNLLEKLIHMKKSGINKS